MNVLVLGAGGIIGCALLEALFTAGAQVSALVVSKSAPKALAKAARWYTISEYKASELLAKNNWSAVVDLRALQVDDVKLVSHSLSKVDKWINISSMYVYRDFSSEPEHTGCQKLRSLQEADPCIPSGPYGEQKYAIEQYLQTISNSELQTLSLRVPFVIGRYDRSTRVTSYLDRMRQGFSLELHANGDKVVEIIPATVLARIIVELIHKPNWSLLPEVLNVAPRNKLTLREHLQIAAQIMGQELRTSSQATGKPSARTGLSFFNDISIDSSLLESHLGYPLQVNWRNEWAAIVNHYKTNSACEAQYA